MTSDINKYSSSGQRKKLLSFGFVASLTVIPLSQIPIVPNLARLLVGALFTVFSYVITVIFEGILGAIGSLFAFGTSRFLFFNPPGEINGLEAVWFDFLVVYWAFMPIAGGVFFLGMQLFPEKEEANIYRFMERFLISVFVIVLTNPQLPDNLDVFSLSVVAVNSIGEFIFPTTYTLGFFGEGVNAIVGSLAGATAGAGAALGAIFVGWKFLIGILLTILTFYLVLAMRMLLVYSTYAMMPLLMSLWVVDIGPLKYGKMVAEMVFKITGMLLLLGIVISGILATTNEISGGTQIGAGIEALDMPEIDEEDIPDGTEEAKGAGEELANEAEGGDHSDNNPELEIGIFTILFRMVSWVGGLVLVVALCTSMLGMLLSAGNASRNLGGGGAKASGGGAAGAIGVKTYGGGDNSGGTGLTGLGDSPEITHTDDGTIIQGQDSDSGLVIGDDGFVSTFDNSENVESHSLSDKLKYNTGRVTGKIKEMDENSDYTDGAVTNTMGSISSKSTKWGKKGGKKAKELGGKVPGSSTMKKAGGLAMKGSKAYWDVFKQPDFISSVGKAREMAAGVGAPTEPDPEEQGPTSEDDLGEESFNTGYQAPPRETADNFYDDEKKGSGGNNGDDNDERNNRDDDGNGDGESGDQGRQETVGDTGFEETMYTELNTSHNSGDTDDNSDFGNTTYNDVNESNRPSNTKTTGDGSVEDLLEDHEISSPAGYESFVVSDDDGEEYNVDEVLENDELGGNRPTTENGE